MRGGIFNRFFMKGIFPHQLSLWLDFPVRRFILSPRKLADRLHLKESFRVLEIGPGPGYFSVEVAMRLSDGCLELLDIQREMLKKVRRKVVKKGLTNVNYISGDAQKLPFRNEIFDVVFLIAVLGEIPDKEKCLNSIYHILKPSGMLSITEQPGDPDFIPIEMMLPLIEKHGFKHVESYGKNKNYTLNFIKM